MRRPAGHAPPPVPHRRLLNESVMLGSKAILQKLPVEYSPELELEIQRAVRQAVLHYADGMDTLDRQLRPLAHARGRA